MRRIVLIISRRAAFTTAAATYRDATDPTALFVAAASPGRRPPGKFNWTARHVDHQSITF